MKSRDSTGSPGAYGVALPQRLGHAERIHLAIATLALGGHGAEVEACAEGRVFPFRDT